MIRHAVIDDARFTLGEGDTLAEPTHAEVQLANDSGNASAPRFVIDGSPLQRKLSICEVTRASG